MDKLFDYFSAVTGYADATRDALNTCSKMTAEHEKKTEGFVYASDHYSFDNYKGVTAGALYNAGYGVGALAGASAIQDHEDRLSGAPVDPFP